MFNFLYYNKMEKKYFTIEELNAAVSAAVNAAMDARENEKVSAFITRKAAAKRIGCSLSSLWRWAKNGYLKPIHRGRAVWYLEEDIVKFERGEITM